jgi:hypothetical protein
VLLQKQIPGSLPTPLANACRAVAHQVIDLLQLPMEEVVPLQGIARHAANGSVNTPQPMAPQPLAVAA